MLGTALNFAVSTQAFARCEEMRVDLQREQEQEQHRLVRGELSSLSTGARADEEALAALNQVRHFCLKSGWHES